MCFSHVKMTLVALEMTILLLSRFLGTVDKLGTAFEDNHIATGYGAYIALPLLRNAYEKNKNMTKAEAKELLTKCMQVLFYRDARSYPKVIKKQY